MPATPLPKKAFITGVSGQDGSYLAEFLLSKGYEVHGMIRRSSNFNTSRVDHLYKNSQFVLHYGDMTDGTSLNQLVGLIKPDEIYNLAAQSHVRVSFDIPEYTSETIAIGTLKLLDAIRAHNLCRKSKFYNASTSELFGDATETPQNELTPFRPRSPYGCAKLFAHSITVNYREAYNMFCVNGILFNHESPRRGPTFVTQKIVRGAVRIKLGLESELRLGNLNAIRDWGHAKDYVKAMWLAMQQEKPSNWIVASGEQHSVREFCELAFEHLGIEIAWKGEGLGEVGYEKKGSGKPLDMEKEWKEDESQWQGQQSRVLVRVDSRYFRAVEVDALLGDAKMARREMGWAPTYTFRELVEEMVESEWEAQKSGKDYWS